MRLSADECEGEAFIAWSKLFAERRLPAIFLNGEPQHVVMTADDEEGAIVRCVLDADGNLLLNPDGSGEILTERVEGVVRIEIPAEAAARSSGPSARRG